MHLSCDSCRDALTKMKDVYIKNPHLGDPDSIDPRLEEIIHSLEKLQLEGQKFEVICLLTNVSVFQDKISKHSSYFECFIKKYEYMYQCLM